MPSGTRRPGLVCQLALSRTRMMIRSRLAPASCAKVARSFSKNGLETPLAMYQNTSPARQRRCRGLDEGGHVEPLKAVISRSTRPLAGRCPDTADNRLQSDAMLIAGEDFNGLIRMLRCFFLDSNRELFLNSACSSGVARSGCSGRGVWIDQPIARSASQPR